MKSQILTLSAQIQSTNPHISERLDEIVSDKQNQDTTLTIQENSPNTQEETQLSKNNTPVDEIANKHGKYVHECMFIFGK